MAQTGGKGYTFTVMNPDGSVPSHDPRLDAAHRCESIRQSGSTWSLAAEPADNRYTVTDHSGRLGSITFVPFKESV